MITIAIVIGSIVLLCAAIFFGIQVWVYLWLFYDALRLQKTLEKCNRTISLHEATKKIQNNEGIIIVDAPTLGWNVSRIWWSSDKDFLPRTFNTEESKFFPPEDATNYDRFIDSTTGCAKLVSGFIFTERLAKYLQKHFAMSEYPFIFTGGVLFHRHPPQKQRQP